MAMWIRQREGTTRGQAGSAPAGPWGCGEHREGWTGQARFGEQSSSLPRVYCPRYRPRVAPQHAYSRPKTPTVWQRAAPIEADGASIIIEFRVMPLADPNSRDVRYPVEAHGGGKGALRKDGRTLLRRELCVGKDGDDHVRKLAVLLRVRTESRREWAHGVGHH